MIGRRSFNDIKTDIKLHSLILIFYDDDIEGFSDFFNQHWGFGGRFLVGGDFDVEGGVDGGGSFVVRACDETEDLVGLGFVACFDRGQGDGVECEGSQGQCWGLLYLHWRLIYFFINILIVLIEKAIINLSLDYFNAIL